MAKKPAQAGAAVSLKVTLDHIRPPIWRRLALPASMTLGGLHRTLQQAMGWDGGHMHAFDVGGEQYGDPDEEMEDCGNEERLTLAGLAKKGVKRFRYTYDFGDTWDHTILIEAKAPPPGVGAKPTCLAGARACPPEDCGGPPGYDGVLAALKAPDRPENRELLEWVGGDYDPEAFSVEDTNARMAAR